jgi:hypothetical protein
MKIYDTVKDLLTYNPELRDSDKKLLWVLLTRLDITSNGGQYLTYHNFMDAPNFESVRRCRQKIQELHPELRSSKFVQDKKELIERQRGTYIFREQIKFY